MSEPPLVQEIRQGAMWIRLNRPEAMNSLTNDVEILDRTGTVVAKFQGSKNDVARGIFGEIQSRLIRNR